MKKLLIILITLCGVSCNSAIHETEYLFEGHLIIDPVIWLTDKLIDDE